MAKVLNILYNDSITGVPAVIDLTGGSPNVPPPNPTPDPGPGNPPPNIPPGVGYQSIPSPNGQKKYNFTGPMILDLVNQPPGNPGRLGFIKTAPQIGGDLEAGPAIIACPGMSPTPVDAPVSVYYATSPPNSGAFFTCPVGGTIRVSVLQPDRPWFLDYRTPNA